MQWSLEDIYKNQVRGKVPQRKHLNVVEEQQGELYKQLAGGGSLRIINQGLPSALSRLGSSKSEAKGIENKRWT